MNVPNYILLSPNFNNDKYIIKNIIKNLQYNKKGIKNDDKSLEYLFNKKSIKNDNKSLEYLFNKKDILKIHQS